MCPAIRRGRNSTAPCARCSQCRRMIFSRPRRQSRASAERSAAARSAPSMDTLSRSERAERMRLIRSKDTKPEMAVRSTVYRMGYRYRLHASDLPGCPDIVFRKRRKAIFIHGCFWHLHAGCRNNRPPKSRLDYWKPKLERNAARDAQARRELSKAGWRSMVIWECELDKPARVATRLSRFLGPISV